MNDAFSSLTKRQQQYVNRVIAALTAPVQSMRNVESDFASEDFMDHMADVLRGHHVSSTKPLGKELFEHALAGVLADLGHEVALSSMGHPGADLLVDGVGWSLKTQADQGIKPDFIHVSKFMELGKGAWVTEGDLARLRDSMLRHMEDYERIFTLRYLAGSRARRGRGDHEYELVEIPKVLLQKAANANCVMRHDSKQNPKPGSCLVMQDGSSLAFELYFDGGTERKLQVRKLRVDLCMIHACWIFQDTLESGRVGATR